MRLRTPSPWPRIHAATAALLTLGSVLATSPAIADTAAPAPASTITMGPAIAFSDSVLLRISKDCLFNASDVVVHDHSSALVDTPRGDFVLHHVVASTPEHPGYGCAAVVVTAGVDEMDFQVRGNIWYRTPRIEQPGFTLGNGVTIAEAGESGFVRATTFSTDFGPVELEFDHQLTVDESHHVSGPITDEATSAARRDAEIAEAKAVLDAVFLGVEEAIAADMAAPIAHRDAVLVSSPRERDAELARITTEFAAERQALLDVHAAQVTRSAQTRDTAIRAATNRATRAVSTASRTRTKAVQKANRTRTRAVAKAKAMPQGPRRTAALTKARKARTTAVRRADATLTKARRTIEATRKREVAAAQQQHRVQAAARAVQHPAELRALAQRENDARWYPEHLHRERINDAELAVSHAKALAEEKHTVAYRPADRAYAQAVDTAQREHTERVTGRIWTVLPEVEFTVNETVHPTNVP